MKHTQIGLSLLVSMIVLAVMSIAAIGLIRTVDTGVLVAGNLAFRQSATHAADLGIEAARTWLLNNATDLSNDNAAAGYYASNPSSLDITGNKTPATNADGSAVVYALQVSWPGVSLNPGMAGKTPYCSNTSIGNTGNTYCYIINRACDTTGAIDSAKCSTKLAVTGGSTKGGARQMGTYQQGSPNKTSTLGYYRVTVRVTGPRNNVSYTQAFLII